METRILTWNINGIRSIKEGLREKWKELDSDIICVQETKVTRDMLEESMAVLKDYNSYFAFSRKRTGYSGVATYCRNSVTPIQAEEGLAGTLPSAKLTDSLSKEAVEDDDEFSKDCLKALDAEGRCVITRHRVKVESGREKGLVLINVYCPRADSEKPERETYKLSFYKLLERRANALTQGGKNFVVILGDINTSHKEIDHCDPYEEFGDNPSRRWMDKLLSEEGGFVDSFRYLHPEVSKAFTCWNTKMNCRSTNYGTRIDYVLIDRSLLPHLASCEILSSILGSDHCPVKVSFRNLEICPASAPPSHCTKYYPEFSGTQMSLTTFLQPKDNAKMTVKRSLPEEENTKPNTSKKSVNSKKQATLLNFYTKVVPASKIPLETVVEKKEPFESEVGSFFENVPENAKKKVETANAWKALLKGPPAVPLCKGHQEPCVERIVKKKGPNMGRRFWVCQRGEGKADDPEARCDYFQWIKK